MTLEWRRAPGGIGNPVDAYYTEAAGLQWAIFPEVGGRGWEVCWAGPDDGYELRDFAGTVADAKRLVEYYVARELAASVG